MKPNFFLLLLFCLALSGCASLMVDIDPQKIATQASNMQTRVVGAVTDTAPLRATSQRLIRTVVASGATQAPPVLTSVSRAVSQISSGLDYTHFSWPLVVAVPREGCRYASTKCRNPDPLTGMELTTGPSNKKISQSVLAAGPGTVARIQPLKAGCAEKGGDCGLGNTVILQHILRDGTRLYTLYAHLGSINSDLVVGECVQAGTKLGMLGSSGYGEAKHWKKAFLHFEFKSLPVLGDPRTARADPDQRPEGRFFAYLTDKKKAKPDEWGYTNPEKMIADAEVMNCH